MIAKLIRRNKELKCSECMMPQRQLEASCPWCGALFSNYEEVYVQNIKDINEEIIKEIGNKE